MVGDIIFCQPQNSVLFAIFLATEMCLCYANLVWLFAFWVKPFEIFCQPHNSFLFAFFLATERCLCYANLVWIICILSQAFRNLLSTTQLSFACYFLSNRNVSMLCQSCIGLFTFWVKPFEIFCQPHNSVLFAIFLATEMCLCYANLVLDYLHFDLILSKSFVNHTT